MEPIHQFQIKNHFTLGKIGGVEIAFTNAALSGRMQALAEISYEFVANTLRSTAGTEGMKVFPLVFSLFMFILVRRGVCLPRLLGRP